MNDNMNELESSYNNITSNNSGFNSASALQIRLDPSSIIENVELFLSGKKIVVEQDDAGKIATRHLEIGKPKANSRGIQAILNRIQLVINPQAVQGNFSCDSPSLSTKYEDYIYYIRCDFAETLMINLYEWDVEEEDYDDIIDSIMNLIEPFMTRLIGNKEREGYADTFKTIESNKINENTGFNLFNKK